LAGIVDFWIFFVLVPPGGVFRDVVTDALGLFVVPQDSFVIVPLPAEGWIDSNPNPAAGHGFPVSDDGSQGGIFDSRAREIKAE
jgi:hypothetical protein